MAIRHCIFWSHADLFYSSSGNVPSHIQRGYNKRKYQNYIIRHRAQQPLLELQRHRSIDWRAIKERKLLPHPVYALRMLRILSSDNIIQTIEHLPTNKKCRFPSRLRQHISFFWKTKNA